VAVPDGVGARLLGDAQQGVLDNGDVVEFGVDGDAEPVVVGGADLLQGRDEPGPSRLAGRNSSRRACMSRSASAVMRSIAWDLLIAETAIRVGYRILGR
jgi:hypothetical protein